MSSKQYFFVVSVRISTASCKPLNACRPSTVISSSCPPLSPRQAFACKTCRKIFVKDLRWVPVSIDDQSCRFDKDAEALHQNTPLGHNSVQETTSIGTSVDDGIALRNVSNQTRPNVCGVHTGLSTVAQQFHKIVKFNLSARENQPWYTVAA